MGDVLVYTRCGPHLSTNLRMCLPAVTTLSYTLSAYLCSEFPQLSFLWPRYRTYSTSY